MRTFIGITYLVILGAILILMSGMDQRYQVLLNEQKQMRADLQDQIRASQDKIETYFWYGPRKTPVPEATTRP
jgi:hypothetical protein